MSVSQCLSYKGKLKVYTHETVTQYRGTHVNLLSIALVCCPFNMCIKVLHPSRLLLPPRSVTYAGDK